MSFRPGQYVWRKMPDGKRYVYRIVADVTSKCYVIQVPLFVVWGSAFARWSPERSVTKSYLERTCTVLPAKIRELYATIKRGDSTSKLF